jgi:hypothetical protein
MATLRLDPTRLGIEFCHEEYNGGEAVYLELPQWQLRKNRSVRLVSRWDQTTVASDASGQCELQSGEGQWLVEHGAWRFRIQWELILEMLDRAVQLDLVTTEKLGVRSISM